MDVLQQQLLAPLLQAARARDAAQEADGAAGDGGPGSAEPEQPLLRVQVSTLAPCVSNYTLHFLRQMAFNITEGHTYAGGWAAPGVASYRLRVSEGMESCRHRVTRAGPALPASVWLSPPAVVHCC